MSPVTGFNAVADWWKIKRRNTVLWHTLFYHPCSNGAPDTARHWLKAHSTDFFFLLLICTMLSTFVDLMWILPINRQTMLNYIQGEWWWGLNTGFSGFITTPRANFCSWKRTRRSHVGDPKRLRFLIKGQCEIIRKYRRLSAPCCNCCIWMKIPAQALNITVPTTTCKRLWVGCLCEIVICSCCEDLLNFRRLQRNARLWGQSSHPLDVLRNLKHN